MTIRVSHSSTTESTESNPNDFNTGVQKEAEPENLASTRVINGGARINAETGEVEVMLTERASTEPEGTGILASARNTLGRPLSAAELTPDAIVAFNGTTMRMQDALAIGLVGRDEHGRYVELNEEQQKAAVDALDGQREQVQPEALASVEAEAFETTLAGKIEPSLFNSMLEGIATTGNAGEQRVELAAQALGISRAEAFAEINKLRDAYFAAADAAATEAGVTDLQAWHEYFNSLPRAQAQDAMRQLVHTRNSTALRALAERHIRGTTATAEQKAAHSVRVVNGVELVLIAGMELPVGQARRMGLI